MKKLFYPALLLLAVGLVFTGCKKEPALGTEENPIVWAFVPSGENERIMTGADALGKLVQEKTGYYIKTVVASSYPAVIEALGTDPPKAHITSLATFSYVKASSYGYAHVRLVAVRYGSAFYTGQIIAGADTGIEKLEDIAGKTFARPEEDSTSGWIIPRITLKAAGVDTENNLKVKDAGSHDAVVIAVYSGEADAGATFVDARNNVEDEYPDVKEKVKVIAVSKQIPNDGVQFSNKMDKEMEDKIVKALLEISATEEGKKALNIAYEWSELVEKDDTFYDPFRQVLQASGVSIDELGD